METILGDVFTWSWFSEPHGYNFNSLADSRFGRKHLYRPGRAERMK